MVVLAEENAALPHCKRGTRRSYPQIPRKLCRTNTRTSKAHRGAQSRCVFAPRLAYWWRWWFIRLLVDSNMMYCVVCVAFGLRIYGWLLQRHTLFFSSTSALQYCHQTRPVASRQSRATRNHLHHLNQPPATAHGR